MYFFGVRSSWPSRNPVLGVWPIARNTPAASTVSSRAGSSVLASLTARVDRPNPALYIGSGKADEAKELCALHDIDLVLVNASLSPVQERNLERHLQSRVPVCRSRPAQTGCSPCAEAQMTL
jgi:hypothetical protein